MTICPYMQSDSAILQAGTHACLAAEMVVTTKEQGVILSLSHNCSCFGNNVDLQRVIRLLSASNLISGVSCTAVLTLLI